MGVYNHCVSLERVIFIKYHQSLHVYPPQVASGVYEYLMNPFKIAHGVYIFMRQYCERHGIVCNTKKHKSKPTLRNSVSTSSLARSMLKDPLVSSQPCVAGYLGRSKSAMEWRRRETAYELSHDAFYTRPQPLFSFHLSMYLLVSTIKIAFPIAPLLLLAKQELSLSASPPVLP